MCIVIDINTLSCVFNKEDSRHKDFRPVKDWILDGKGKVVFGGTKYIEELTRSPRYLRLFNLLKDARSFPFITHSLFFKKKNRPKIYSSRRNVRLLNDANIADCCKPSVKTTNTQKEQLKGSF